MAAKLFSRYVNSLFGTAGTWIMAGIITLASLTTLVGVTSAVVITSPSFRRVFLIHFGLSLTAMTTIISQYGLTKLPGVTIPALLLIYPNGDHVSGFTASA